MKYLEMLKNLLLGVRKFFGRGNVELQPKDILVKLFHEMEKRKKFGIEEKAYVPNTYTIYLSPFDFEEISPLLSGIKEQLKNKLMDRVKKKGYKLLSLSLGLEIRDDSGLMKNQIVIESSFMKEKILSGSSLSGDVGLGEKEKLGKNVNHFHGVSSSTVHRVESTRLVGVQPMHPVASDAVASPPSGVQIRPDISNASGNTKIIEDRKTKLIDLTRVRLEVVKGEGGVIALREGEHTFGRGREAEYLLKDEEDTISRLHFKLIVREDRVKIKDLGSLNGTRVNDIEIEEAELQKGDMISAGKLLLKVA
jgi:hypothetical protein